MMKSQYPYNFALSNNEVVSLLNRSSITLDTMVLRNLYKFSSETRTELINKYKALGERLWISHQVADEYTEGRIAEIESVGGAHRTAADQLKKFREMLGSKKQQPHIDQSLFDSFAKVATEVEAALREGITTADALLETDPIFEELQTFLQDRVGPPLKSSVVDLHEEAELRRKHHLPPGLGDKSVGDLMIWKQIIEYARTHNRSVVLISSDEGWQNKQGVRGEFRGPHTIIAREFHQLTGMEFYLLTEIEFARLSDGVSDRATLEIADTLIIEDPVFAEKTMQEYMDYPIGKLEGILENLKYQFEMLTMRKHLLELPVASGSATPEDRQKLELVESEIASVKEECVRLYDYLTRRRLHLQKFTKSLGL